LPAELRRQIVAYPTQEAPGTIVIDTPHTFLYFVLGGGRAIRYAIGVGGLTPDNHDYDQAPGPAIEARSPQNHPIPQQILTAGFQSSAATTRSRLPMNRCEP